MKLICKSSAIGRTPIKPTEFRKYNGRNIQYLNRQYSKLTPNISGKNISKDHWEEKLQILFTELPGLKRLHKLITTDLPHEMSKLSIRMSQVHISYMNSPSQSTVNKLATFNDRIVSLCGSEVLNAYFYVMHQCMKQNKKYTINMLLKDVPLDMFFYIVFIKYYSILYRQNWGLRLTIDKLLPIPIFESLVQGTESHEISFNIIASKMAKICITNFNGGRINLGLHKDDITSLMMLCSDLINTDEDIIKEKINLNSKDIPCVDIFIKLDKTNLFYTKDMKEV